MLSEQQINQVLNIIDRGGNIIIGGMMATGKSALYNELMAACSKSKHNYALVDEAITETDIDFVNGRLFQGNSTPIMFTSHLFDADKIKRKFPAFKGVIIHTFREDASFGAELEVVE